jgi:hypothetical protein
MGRLVNALVVGAVALLVTVAAVDALRGEEDNAVPAAVRGELVYSDADCRRHAIRLPDLARRDFRTIGCGVFTRYDNLGVKEGDVAWFAYPVPGGTTTLLTREQLAAEVGDGFRVRDVAWLRGVRFAAVVSGTHQFVAVFDRSSMVASLDPRAPGPARVRASPSGRYFAVLAGNSVQVYDRDGRVVPVRAAARSIAWSPGERYAALATEGRVLIVPAGGGEVVASIPVDAVDVDWR